MKLSEFLQDVGQPVPYYPQIAKQFGGVKAAIFLCRFIWWTGRQADPDGWIYKTQVEIEEETGLNAEEQLCARKKLKQCGVLEEKNQRIEHRIYYRVNFEQMDADWSIRVVETPVEYANSQIRESGKVGMAIPGKSDSTNPGKSDSTYSTEYTRIDGTGAKSPTGAPPPKSSHKGKGPPDPKIREFTDKWGVAYREVLDEKYVYNGSKDTEAVKRALTSGLSVDELISLAARAWRKPALFYCKQSLHIAGFVAKINEIRNELKTGGDPASRVSHTQRLQALDELIEGNPANRSSSAYRPSCSDEDKARLISDRALRKSIVAEIGRAQA